MVRVPVPDGINAGVFDLRSYGEGLVEVEETDAGTRYIDIDESTVDRVHRDWTQADYEFDARPLAETAEPATDEEAESEQDESESEPEAEPEAEARFNSDGEPLCMGTTGSGDPCTRTVDEPGGYCYQHEPEE